MLRRRAVANPTQESAEIIEMSVNDDVDLVFHPLLVRERRKQAAGTCQARDGVVTVSVVVPAVDVRIVRNEQRVNWLRHHRLSPFEWRPPGLGARASVARREVEHTLDFQSGTDDRGRPDRGVRKLEGAARGSRQIASPQGNPGRQRAGASRLECRLILGIVAVCATASSTESSDRSHQGCPPTWRRSCSRSGGHPSMPRNRLAGGSIQ